MTTTPHKNNQVKIQISDVFPSKESFDEFLVLKMNFNPQYSHNLYDVVKQYAGHAKRSRINAGIIKALSICSRPVIKKYWTDRGYTDIEAASKVKQLQANRSNIGWVKKPPAERADSCLLKKEYWIKNGLSEIDALQKISEIQTARGKKSPISKNMKDLEYRKNNTVYYVEHHINKGLSLEQAEKKVLEAKIKLSDSGRMSLLKNGGIPKSLIANKFFDEVVKRGNFDTKEVYGGNYNHEWWIVCPQFTISLIYCDFKYKNKIIEFYGDYFHANPAIFNKDSHHHPFKKDRTASQTWSYDKKRAEIIKSHGFDLHIVWEKDYKEQKEKTIQQAINFINNENSN